MLSLVRCSETGVTVAALLLYFDDFLSHAVKPHWSKPIYKELFVVLFLLEWKSGSAKTGPAGPLPPALLMAQPLTYTHPSLCCMSIIVSPVPELPSKSFESGTKSPVFSVKVNQSPVLSLESPSKSYPYVGKMMHVGKMRVRCRHNG